MRGYRSRCAAIAVLFLCGTAFCQEAQKPAVRSAFATARVMTGTVAAVEMQERIVTLRDSSGREYRFLFMHQASISDMAVGESAIVQYRDTGQSPLPAVKIRRIRTASSTQTPPATSK